MRTDAIKIATTASNSGTSLQRKHTTRNGSRDELHSEKQMTKKRQAMLLSSLLEELATTAQKLVSSFMEVAKGQEDIANADAAENGGDGDDEEGRDDFVSTTLENLKMAVKLIPLWNSVKGLCVSIEDSFGQGNAGGVKFQPSIEPYLNEISKIISIATNTTAKSVSEAKSFQISFPFYILKLLSVVKSSVKAFTDDLKSTNNLTEPPFTTTTDLLLPKTQKESAPVILKLDSLINSITTPSSNPSSNDSRQTPVLDVKQTVASNVYSQAESVVVGNGKSLVAVGSFKLNQAVNVKQTKDFFEGKSMTTPLKPKSAALSSTSSLSSKPKLVDGGGIVSSLSLNALSGEKSDFLLFSPKSNVGGEQIQPGESDIAKSDENPDAVMDYIDSLMDDSFENNAPNDIDAGVVNNFENKRQDIKMETIEVVEIPNQRLSTSQNNEVEKKSSSNDSIVTIVKTNQTRTTTTSVSHQNLSSISRQQSAQKKSGSQPQLSTIEKSKYFASNTQLQQAYNGQHSSDQTVRKVNYNTVEYSNNNAIFQPSLTSLSSFTELSGDVSAASVANGKYMRKPPVIDVGKAGLVSSSSMRSLDWDGSSDVESKRKNSLDILKKEGEQRGVDDVLAVSTAPKMLDTADILKSKVKSVDTSTKFEVSITHQDEENQSSTVKLQNNTTTITTNSEDKSTQKVQTSVSLATISDHRPTTTTTKTKETTTQQQTPTAPESSNTAPPQHQLSNHMNPLSSNMSNEAKKTIENAQVIPLGTTDGQIRYSTGNDHQKSSDNYSNKEFSPGVKMVSPFFSPSKENQFSFSALPVVDDKITQVILIPLNGMFELCYLNLSSKNLLGRSNTQKYDRFKAFPTQVVSRSHLEIWEEKGKVYLKDVGSSSGTFLNGVRLSDPGIASTPFDIQSGDYVQLGKDYIDPKQKGQKPIVVNVQHRCVKLQIVIALRKDAQPKPPTQQPIIEEVKKLETNSIRAQTAAEQIITSTQNASALVIDTTTKSKTQIIPNTQPIQTIPAPITTTIKQPTPPLLLYQTTPAIPSQSKKSLQPPPAPENSTITTKTEKGPSTSMLSRSKSIGSSSVGAMLARSKTLGSAIVRVGASSTNKSMDGVLNKASSNGASLRGNMGGSQPLLSTSQPSLGVITKTKDIVLGSKRDVFVLTTSETSNKVKKIQFLTALGVDVLTVNLKRWVLRKHVLMEDLRPNYAKTRNLDLVQTNPATNAFTLYVAGGPVLGKIEYVNKMKLHIHPTVNFAYIYNSSMTSPSTSSPSSQLSLNKSTSVGSESGVSSGSLPIKPPQSPLPTSTVGAIDLNVTFCVSGDFKEGTWIIVMKHNNSRQQRLIGESKGRQITRKNVRESTWECTIELEDSIYSQLLLSAICYLTLGDGGF